MPQDRLRVLIVDDEPLIRLWLRQSLSERGYHVVDAESGAAALALLNKASRRPDVVLVDDPSDDVSDLGLAARIVKLLPAARVIVMSADLDADASRALKDGVFAVLNKPFEIRHLLELLDRRTR